jgi:hypothetical protein
MFAKIKEKLAAFREKIKGYKTIIWNGILALAAPLAIAADKLGDVDFSDKVGPIGAVVIGFVVAAIGMWLRYMTTGPVGAKGDEAPAPDVKAGD